MYTNPIDECLEKGEYHVERVKCPECNYIQQAEVMHTQPFWVYVHHCRHCGHIIMESEWNCIDTEIKLPFSMKRFFNSVTTLELRFFMVVTFLSEVTMSLNFIVRGEKQWWMPLAIFAGIVIVTYLVLLVQYVNKKR